MSSISMDIPTLQINDDNLQNFIGFIYKHEWLLNEFGAIKIQLKADCKLALKKRRKNTGLRPVMERIVKMSKDEPIYSVQKADNIDNLTEQTSLISDECSFWSSLSCSNDDGRKINISILPKQSFFSSKTSRLYFDLHRLPAKSLLKLGGSKMTRQIIPCVKRAHGPGAIFPLASAHQRLFTVNYHHGGGAHRWYIIPNRERERVQRIVSHENFSSCLDHGKLLIDPSILDKNHIRYHRIIQYSNEFIVISAGALAQGFTEAASWSESINFALPSWITEGHASAGIPSWQCNISEDYLPETIDLSVFRHELIQKYINSHLKNITKNEPIALTDYNDIDMVTAMTTNSTKTNSSNGIYLFF